MAELVVVFGGSGFIGKQVVRALAKRGKRVRIAMRRPHLGAELRVMGDVGQIQLVQANLRFPDSVDAALEGADAVVNLVAVLHESGTQNFEALHVEGARAVAEAAAKRGIKRVVHISAIGAAEKGAKYAQSKYQGERAVLDAVPSATILRPSIVFGPEDAFFNRFARMAQTTLALPLIGGGKTKFQPVFVGDVADAVVAALDKREAQGRVYELGGPRTYTFKQLLEFITKEIARPRPLIPLSFVFAYPLGLLTSWVFKLIPFAAPPLTGDQVNMLRKDNIVGADPLADTIQDLGVTSLETVEAIVPAYLWRFRPYGQFQTKQNPA
ncbi:MAG: complex I NDUFA9 subunit family protein [Hyphomonadaceae bacterium JAD_PAG50586_4]|nr:MAG: complex I NDUFA9 subunit family protein [Hyphomonadaceae bacterium JAD_PAG50586_4]